MDEWITLTSEEAALRKTAAQVGLVALRARYRQRPAPDFAATEAAIQRIREQFQRMLTERQRTIGRESGQQEYFQPCDSYAIVGGMKKSFLTTSRLPPEELPCDCGCGTIISIAADWPVLSGGRRRGLVFACREHLERFRANGYTLPQEKDRRCSSA